MRNNIFRKGLFIFFFLSIFAIASDRGFSEETVKQHSIDIWLKKCITADSSTTGSVKCTIKANALWDKEMNKTYKELMGKLPKKQRTLLKQSQVQWIHYRDKEIDFINEFYGNFEGTIWQNIMNGNKMDIVKKRTLKLQIYLNYFKEN